MTQGRPPIPPIKPIARDLESPEPFWRKPLAALTPDEWESLCDGCGRCCLVKLEDEDTSKIYYTDIACKLLDPDACRCADYTNRDAIVPDCVRLTLESVYEIPWLPPTCAYRLRAENKDLPDWHPLVSGDPDSVRKAGVSAQGRIAASEGDVEMDDLPDYIVDWPEKWPTRQAGRGKKPKG